jgi:hypothetical protein
LLGSEGQEAGATEAAVNQAGSEERAEEIRLAGRGRMVASAP